MNTKEPEQPKHLAEYYYILSKHKWIVLSSFILIVGLTVLHTAQMKPVYRATATMVIENERRRSQVTGEPLDVGGFYMGALKFNTHFNLIVSRPVLEHLIRDLNLDQLNEVKDLEVSAWKELLSKFKENVQILRGEKRSDDSVISDDKVTQLARRLRGKINVQGIKDTLLLKISAEDRDPVIARNIANSLARSYIAFNISNRLKFSKNTLSWMTNQLYEMKKKLEASEEEFLAYKQQAKLFSLEGKQRVVDQKIADFNDAYLKAKNRRLELDGKLAKLRSTFESGADILYARSLVQNALIDNLYAQLLDSELELSRLSKVYKHKHPKVIKITAAIDKTRKRLYDEVRKEVENLRSERSVLFEKEKVLQDTIAGFENEALETNRKALKYGIFKRNRETNKKLYDTLLSKVKETNIGENIDVSNIRIVEEAIVPGAPVRPNKVRNLMWGIVFGLMTGIGLAFLREYLDRSLRTEEDVQRYLGLPALSIIPVADRMKPKMVAALRDDPAPEEVEKSTLLAGGQTRLNRKKRPSKKKITFPFGLFLDYYPINSRFAEAYRNLRTNIDFSFIEKDFRSLLITSAGEQEGKTLTAANLAYTISRTGKSVLMVDADLRKPKLSRLNPSHTSPGLTGLLSHTFNTDVRSGALGQVGTSDLFRLLVLQKKTGILNLSEGKEEVELVFLQGDLIDVDWQSRPKERRLGATLVKNNLVTEEQARRAMLRHRDTGQKLGFILINMGLIKEEDLTGPLTIQMLEGLRIALQFKSGRFSFKDLPAPEFDRASFDPVDLKRLYAQATLGGEELPYLGKEITATIVETGVSGLFLLPGGNLPPNPSEILASDRMSFLLGRLKKRFDVLIIDSPPILPASDSLILAPRIDGVILLVKAGAMNRKMVIRAVQQLKLAQANLTGVALNQVDVKKGGYYRYYHKYYSKYYGES